MKIQKIEIISDYSAPMPSGWKKTKYGYMENEPEIVSMRKINEIIEWINSKDNQLL